MPFLPSSRYAGVPTVQVRTRDGRLVTAIQLRVPPPPGGRPHVVTDTERVDLISHRAYGDGSRFWRVADGNSELEARELEETGRVIEVPEE